ncbi:MAG: MCE family protein [Planctomycetales bacterium]|nr:MCE family protein [Planctomycetales bacterium]MCA9167887.1 MCE family protein [Planctomycetales bacterium]
MEERILQFRVGVLVAATLIIGIILVMIFEELPQGFGHRKTIYIHFDQAPGIAINTPVRKYGVLIGRVTEVRLDDNIGGVLVTARLDANRDVKKNEDCRIATGNILGDTMIEFVRAEKKGESNESLEDGAFLEGLVSKDPFSMVSDAMQVFTSMADELRVALSSVQAAGEDVGSVARNLNVLVVNNQDQLNRIMGKTESAIGRFDTTMTAVQDIVSDEELRVRLKQVLDDIPQVLADASNLMNGLGRVATEAEQNMIFLQGLTKPLGERGDDLVTSLQQSIDRLDTVLIELQTFGKAINQSEGSLGQFVHNPELYQRLNNAAANVEELTYKLQPVVDDARVISDKLARNPGRILRGAIGPQQSGLK